METPVIEKVPLAIAQPLPEKIVIEAPMGGLDEGYLSRHVQVQLNGHQRETLRRLVNGLRDSDERLADGKAIESNADAVKWILEQLAENT